MLRSLYTGWTGMYTEQKRLDVISNNMANATTVGYKKEGVTNQSFDESLTIKIRDKSANWQQEKIGHMPLGVKIGEVYTDYSQGSIRQTDTTYDLALDGPGFFVVNVMDRTGATHESLTRAGSFHITRDGYIVDVDGNHLQSQAGDLQVSVDAGEVVIDEFGNVIEDGEIVDQLLLKDYEDYDYLKKFGDTYYREVNGATEKEAAGLVRQGYTEQSNVNVVNEMVSLINITRAYEANQKVIKSVDNVMELAVSSVGKV